MASHLAFVCKGSIEWALKKKKKPYEGYRKSFEKILEVIEMQIRNNIPITTFYLLPASIEEHDDQPLMIDEITAFLSEFVRNKVVHDNKIKISVLGKWYSLPTRIIDPIKKIIDETKDYDQFFVNLCINYDGQEEIVDACKMVARRVKLGKIDVDSVSKETVKEDLYSSYFMPPDYIFVTGERKILSGFLLWDSVNSEIIFTKKSFPELNVEDIDKWKFD
jgi:undecaprenyl diphosphate synthase